MDLQFDCKSIDVSSYNSRLVSVSLYDVCETDCGSQGEELLQYVSEENIIKYLESCGYTVEED